MGLFEKKQQITRDEFRQALKESPRFWGGAKIDRETRFTIEHEVFKNKERGRISEPEYKIFLRRLAGRKYLATGPMEKLKMSRTLRFLKRLGGE